MIPRTVICLTSHNRIDCARINQEIIKLNYAEQFLVVHACSGAQRAAYLEDAFVHCDPKPLHVGAIHLIQESLRLAVERFQPRFVVHLEADTWLLDERVLTGYLERMAEEPSLLLATSAWLDPSRFAIGRAWDDLVELPWGAHRLRRLHGIRARRKWDIRDFATQLFVIRTDPEMVDCILSMRPDNHRIAERQLFEAFIARFELDRVLRMREREPVHPHNRWACERLALHSEHWPALGTAVDTRPPGHPLRAAPDSPGKKEALLRYPNVRKGDALNRLLSATNYDYYNPGAARC